MKKISLLIVLLTLCFFTFSQKHKGQFSIHSKMKNAPDYFQWVDKGKMAVKESEVSIDDYLTFLEAVSRDSSEEYVKTLVPSKECELYPYIHLEMGIKSEDKNRKISWIDEEKMQEKIYEKKPVNGYYIETFKKPITGISFEQATQYANWCTASFNYVLKKENKNKIIIFRLPTPDEFQAISKRGIEECGYTRSVCESNIKSWRECKNEKGCALCNCAGKDSCESNKIGVSIYGSESLYLVSSYNPSFIGIYDMQGNAAEMTSEKGIAKGGSYLNTAKECLPEAVQHYTKPEKWLGFRLFAEVVDIEITKMFFDDEGKLRGNR